ncbi:Premnaspirodiene oxygenase [Zea mays]|uniref:Cytochrome P450 CYP71K14 n=3 Tax=Zea mays TaxID=4577 RepID=B6TEH7_MAIZE|nr:putative cytochrome P450 superfamily protein [Zea mays]ACG35510.1 cytochrome P450 CYP71K14 [Zea mays]PWZ23782.1 Premnaspirodiene oxygenase [Zea mays]|eukprot:NP_001169303.1 putative cytochrome P450 superfamily protein [Zea mays]
MAADPTLLLLVPFLAIPLYFFLATRRRTPRGGARLPPGPWALPVVGHLHHLARGLPHRVMRDLARRHGPLMMLRFGEVPVVVASSPAAAREVMRTHDAAFASRPIGPVSRLWFQGAEGILFAPYGDDWRHLRRVCTQELLTARRVQSFRPVREDELRRLLASVASTSGPVNLTEKISTYIADSTVRAIIGSRRLKDRDAYLRMLKGLFGIMPGMSLPDLFPSSRLAMLLSRAPARIQAYRRSMRRIMDGIIQEHRDRAAAGDGDEEDFVDVLLRLQKEVDSQFPLTTENIKTVMLDIFGASTETSTTTLDWAMAELLRNPRVMEKAQREVRQALSGHGAVTEDRLAGLRYLRFVIKESLRLHPPATMLVPRQCQSACQVLGYDVPAGITVIVNAWAIGRDPAHWDEPDKFLPERFEQSTRDFKGADFEFIPFGAGRRICPGMTFGLAHIEIALAALLFHFDWSLPGGLAAEELDMTEAFGIATPRRSDLLVVATPRVPLPQSYRI